MRVTYKENSDATEVTVPDLYLQPVLTFSFLLQDWYAYLRAEYLAPDKVREEQWLREHFHELGEGRFAAVMAAFFDMTERALQYLRRWPDQAADVVRECSLGVVRPGCLGQRLLNNRSSGGTPRDVIAIHAVSAAASAVQGRGALTVANVHICGEGYAGKSMTRQALMKSFNSSIRLLLSSTLPDIPLEDGRTLGMVSASLERASWLSGDTVRVLFHDYGGQEEFRANHAAHLAAPNSVYLLVVPLWDKRPGPNHNKPMELEYIVEKYRTWLKFINTIVPASEHKAQCVTVLNFHRQFTAARGNVDAVVSRLTAVKNNFKASPGCKLTFVAAPILVNSNISASVHKRLLPTLKAVVADLAQLPVPIAPAVQTVLADMQVKDKWPLFSYESDLQALLRAAIHEKHSPSAALVSYPAVAEEVVRTIAEIMQGLLESRRDIVVISVQGGGRISINRPNWLTEQLLGSLFDPRKRPDINQAAALRAVQHQGEPTHLLSGADIHRAVEATLDASTRAMLDAHFIPKLLQHLGVCIPVVVGSNGFARGVAEGDDLARVMHWVPAFSTTAMADKHAIVLPNADHVVARQFKLADPEFCLFPPGYFSSLSVDIVSLYNRTNLVQLFEDGMCLRSGDDSFQIVVRRTVDEKSFVVTVATAGTAPDSSLAFDTMQTITKQFILGENGNSSSSWRGNVQVREFGLHPTLLTEAGAIPLEAVLERLLDPQQRGENLAFYCGLERHRERGLVPCLLQEVLARLAAVDRKLDQQHGEVVSRLEALADGVSALCVRAEAAEEALQRAEGMGAASQEQLASLIEVLSAALPAAGPEAATEGSDAPAVGKVAQSLAQHRDRLHRAPQGGLSNAQLQQMKEEIVGEFSRLAEGMQRAAYEQLRQAEAAQAQRLQQLLDRNRASAVADLEAAMEALRVQQSQMQSVGGIPTDVTELLQQLQASLDAVRAAQDADSYGLHEVPLLLEVVAAQPTGTVRDAAKRCLYEVHRLHFYCPACGTRAASGPNKHGYELRSTRGWVQQAARVLKVTLFALQVASLVTPLPLPRLAELAELLPTSDAQAVAGALDFVRKQVQGNATATNGAVRDAVEKQLTPAQLQALSVTREHVSSVRALLLKAGDSIPPKDSGLAPVVCASTRECAWVCDKCRDTYRERGNACLAVKISLD
jgi:hypothetical protein